MPERHQRPAAPAKAEFDAAIAASAERWFAACVRITRNRALAEDAVQEALLSAWTKREQFAGNARLDTWIHRIAVNAALQVLRKQRPAAWLPIAGELVSDAPAPEDVRAGEELSRDMGNALGELSELERVCFVLKHLEQWRLKEISIELGTGIGIRFQKLI